MKTNIDNILASILEDSLLKNVKEKMLKDGFNEEQVNIYIENQVKAFKQLQNRYSGVDWEDPEIAMTQVEAINEHYAKIAADEEQQAQSDWENEQQFLAGGGEGN